MKMPDPTMMPETIITESNRPSALRNSPACSGTAVGGADCPSAIKPASSSHASLPLCEVCHDLKVAATFGSNYGSVAVHTAKHTGTSIHSNACNSFTYRSAECDVDLFGK